jgi:SAM-dependent methyltransferase
MTANEMVAYALETSPELLPFLPELLADLDELGSDAEQIASILRDVTLPHTARVVDLGCGKGAVAIEIASELGLHVLGIELFEPFVAHATAAAQEAGVAHLCEFRHGDVSTMAEGLPPADVAVFAAVGDVLGTPAETMRVVRQYVRPGGYVLLADVFLRDGGSLDFPGFERYQSRAETVRGLTAWGDALVREVLEVEAGEDDDVDGDAAAIHRRAIALAERYPEHRDQLLAFAAYQAQANTHIAENLVDAVWVLRRSTT